MYSLQGLEIDRDAQVEKAKVIIIRRVVAAEGSVQESSGRRSLGEGGSRGSRRSTNDTLESARGRLRMLYVQGSVR